MDAAPTIGLKITWAARMLRTRFDARARGIGLTRAQWRMIAAIRAQEGVTQSHLAAQLEISSVTAGRILDRLESVSCIERRADPIDRRAYRVYLTPQATPLLASLTTLGREEERGAIAGLSDDEAQTLDRLLQRVVNNLQAADPILQQDDGAVRSRII